MTITSVRPALEQRGAKMARRISRLERPFSRTLRRVWLAGLGALAQADSEGGDDLFRELVHKGEEIEALGKASDSPSPEHLSVADADIVEEGRLILACARLIDGLVQQRRDRERLIEAMLPSTPVPTPPEVLQARRNAAAREELISEFGLLSSTDVAARAGSRAKNTAALANRWKQEGRIFSVPHQGAVYYPAFQFDDEGKPLPVIALILATLGRQSEGWELALWFIASNGWVDGRRPVDLLRSEPEAVAAAAEREAEGLFF
jgi:Poly(hydroxyalcanoate) granule associated protein (phasin)